MTCRHLEREPLASGVMMLPIRKARELCTE